MRAPGPDRDRDTDVEVVALLRAILDELRAARADWDRRGARPLSRADHEQLRRLLPAIAGALGSDEFTVAEALGQPGVRAVTHLAAPALGQLLKRAAGVPVAGYVVQCGTKELHRRLWRVEALV